MGDTRDDVIKEKGWPTSVTENANKAILGFSDGLQVTFLDGTVVHWQQKPRSQKPGSIHTVRPKGGAAATDGGATSGATDPAAVVGRPHELSAVVLPEMKAPPVNPRSARVAALTIFVGALVAGISFRVFFNDPSEVVECLRFRFQPGWTLVFSKVLLWVLLALASSAVCYMRFA